MRFIRRGRGLNNSGLSSCWKGLDSAPVTFKWQQFFGELLVLCYKRVVFPLYLNILLFHFIGVTNETEMLTPEYFLIDDNRILNDGGILIQTVECAETQKQIHDNPRKLIFGGMTDENSDAKISVMLHRV